LKKRSLLAIVLVWSFAATAVVSAQAGDGNAVLARGQSEYQNAKYSDALHDFRDIILNPQYASIHGDAYFWISLSYIALGQLEDAQKNLEYFLLNYPDNANVPEAYYQKGRLLFLQGEYDNAIQVLYTFIKSYATNPYVANGYYWIGESLYQLGHFDEAKKVFAHVVTTYPTSFKVEAAQYRISLIDLMTREQELLKLLKWSHEEAINAQEDYQRREQAYEQAIMAYQREIAALKGPQSVATGASSAANSQSVSALQAEVAQLQSKIQDLTANSQPSAGGASSSQQISRQTLLALKAKALDLEQFYLDWLASHEGSK